MQTLFYLAGNALRIYALYIFIGVFLQKKDLSKWTFFFAYVGFYAVNSAAYLFINIPLLTFSTNIIPSFIITFMYKAKTWKRAFVTLLTYGIYGSWEIIVYCIYVMLNIQGGIIHEFLAPTLFFIASMFIRFFVKQRLQVPSTVKTMYFIMLAFIVIGSVVIGYLTMFDANIKSLAIATILLLLDFFVFYMFDQIIKSYVSQQEAESIKQNKLYLQRELGVMEQAQIKIDCLRHDMKNHFHRIEVLAKEKNTDEILSYIESGKELLTVENQYVKTGNKSFDSMLNFKLGEAEKRNIEFSVDTTLPRELNINSFDLNVILGNILDNAIEAIDKTQDKKLDISVKYDKDTLMMTIGNSFNGEVNPNMQSTKANPVGHGLGLKSVKMTVEKYNGLVEYDYSDNYFVTKVLLYN